MRNEIRRESFDSELPIARAGGRRWQAVAMLLLPLAILSFTLARCRKEEPMAPPAATPAAVAKPTKIRLALNPVPQAAVVIIAAEKGFFREEGLDVEISKFTTGKLAFDAVLGGAADLATW